MVKSIVVICDWCSTEAQVEFDAEQVEEMTGVLGLTLLPDEDWYEVAHGDEERQYCCKECLLSDL